MELKIEQGGCAMELEVNELDELEISEDEFVKMVVRMVADEVRNNKDEFCRYVSSRIFEIFHVNIHGDFGDYVKQMNNLKGMLFEKEFNEIASFIICFRRFCRGEIGLESFLNAVEKFAVFAYRHRDLFLIY